MVKFNDDEDLGKVIAKKQLFSFGAAPIKEFKEIVFAAGGNKFSTLCGFKFESKAETELKEFFVAFVCKLRSKIYHAAANNPSQWFIMKKIGPGEMDCLDKKSCKIQYGFDVQKFFDSDYFQTSIIKFKAAIDKGLKTYVPDFVKKHGMEKAKDLLTSFDGTNENALVKDAVGRYVNAINDSLEYIDSTMCNNKYFKLKDYDVKVEKELSEDEFDGEEGVSINDMLSVSRKYYPNNHEGGMSSSICGVVNGKFCIFNNIDFVKNPNIPDAGTFFLHDGTPASKKFVEEQIANSMPAESEKVDEDDIVDEAEHKMRISELNLEDPLHKAIYDMAIAELGEDGIKDMWVTADLNGNKLKVIFTADELMQKRLDPNDIILTGPGPDFKEVEDSKEVKKDPIEEKDEKELNNKIEEALKEIYN